MPVAVSSTKEQIHRSACRLFREHGFHATSVRDIADAVGIQAGSLYAHYQSKDELLWDIVNESANRFFTAIKPVISSDFNILRKLRDAVIAHVEVIARDLDAAAVYTVEWRHLSDERRRAVTRMRDEYEALFRGLVAAGIRERYLDATDAGMATLFVLSTLNHLFSWYKPDGRMAPEEVGRQLADYIFDGLKRRTA